MSYCNVGDKPKVYFQFNNQAQQIYQANVAPINVTSGAVLANSNYNPSGYQITFNSPQGEFGNITQTIIDYQVFSYGGQQYISTIGCGGSGFGPLDPDHAALLTNTNFTFNYNAHCPTPSSPGQCQITISDNNGNSLFQSQGTCPVTFQVACGNCPDNTIECSCPNYPGYCCLDCGSIEGQLSQLINQVKSL